jgi:hypothetical protein
MQCQLPTSQKEKKRIDEYVSRRPSKINYSSPRTKKKKISRDFAIYSVSYLIIIVTLAEKLRCHFL